MREMSYKDFSMNCSHWARMCGYERAKIHYNIGQ